MGVRQKPPAAIQSSAGDVTKLIKLDYLDEHGSQRRVFVPDNGYAAPEEGIPADMYGQLDRLYADATPDFRRRLYDALWRRGLIEPVDFLQKDTADKYRAAMLEVLRFDALNAIAIAKESKPS